MIFALRPTEPSGSSLLNIWYILMPLIFCLVAVKMEEKKQKKTLNYGAVKVDLLFSRSGMRGIKLLTKEQGKP
ncbi:unnamed protein product [Camellia sinensis]